MLNRQAGKKLFYRCVSTVVHKEVYPSGLRDLGLLGLKKRNWKREKGKVKGSSR